jgi:signal transduction histidine kinase
LNLQEFPIDQFIDETIANFQLIAHSHRVIKVSEPLHLMVTGDQQRLEQVLYNILSNAVKYSPDGKRVLVSVSKADGTVTIQVRDFGVGIPEDEQLNIFERFYRTRGTSRTISGFGLGLYISRDIIKRHNGRIWVQSEENGTSFFISLPVHNTINKPGSTIKNSSPSHEENISN